MPEESIRAQLCKLDTPSVSDAADRLGIPCGLLGIKPVVPGTKMCGEAFTVHFVPCGLEKGTVGDFLDDVDPGMIVVLDNAGREYCTIWGDIMTKLAVMKGVAGTLIDGVCRDVPGIRDLAYPIFTKSVYMVTGKERVEADALNIPVAVSGVKICPGDYILADDSGAVAIPKDRVMDVIAAAQEIEEKEQRIIALIQSGKTLKEARECIGYHHLQSHES